MVRYRYGAEIQHISVAEQGGVVGASLVLDRGPDAYPLYTTAGVLVSAFFLWDGSGYNTQVTGISTDSGGYLPRFEVDDIAELRDANGRSLLPYARGGTGGTALTSYTTQVAALADYPTSFPPATHTHAYTTTSDVNLLIAGASSASVTGNALAKRTANGQLKVATPQADEDAATRLYVQDALRGVTFSYTETMASAPAGTMFAKVCVAGVWPTRGSTRTDLVVAWVSRAATDPAPPIGGTGAVGDDYWQKVDA